MKNKILQTIRQHQLVQPGMHIVIGLSGGPDSLCMFDVFCRIAEDWQLQLYPVHVNHKFRPGAAEEDQDFVERYCEAAGWPCTSFVYNCSAIAEQEGLTPEEAGRKVRYDAFGKVAGAIAEGRIKDADGPVERNRIAIAVGQNADDQAETVLFRLLRGTGVDGLAGIAYKRWDEHGTAVIRPLLDISRQEIEAYCAEENLQPRRDHTNEETVYMRNRIRHCLLPLLREEYNPNMTGTLNRLAESAAMDSDYLWQEAGRAFEEAAESCSSENVKLSMSYLTGLHTAIRIRVYHRALDHIGGGENLTAAHLEGIEQVLQSSSPSASWNLPQGYAAEKQYGLLVFRKILQPETAHGADSFSSPKKNDNFRITACESPIDDGVHVWRIPFSLRKLQDVYGDNAEKQILLRTRENGDFIRIRTGDGIHRKKLQDVLVDMKIPKSQRDQVQLAAIGKEVLWILPDEEWKGRRSAAYQPEEDCAEPIIALEYLW